MQTVKERPYLLQQQPKPDWSRRKKAGYYCYSLGLAVPALLALELVTLLLSTANFDPLMFRGYLQTPMILVMNFLLPLSLYLLMLLFTGRSWLAYLVTAVLALGIAVGNYYLILVRSDPLRFSDIFCLREALDITAKQHYQITLDWKVITAVLVCAACTVALACFSRWTPRIRQRLGLLLGTLGVLAATIPLLLIPEIYNGACQCYRYINTWSTPQLMMSRGVVYSFTYGAVYSATGKPVGYDEQAAGALLESYSDADIPAERKVNVLVVMRESYNDLSDLGGSGVDWSAYDSYHALAAESYTGRMIANAFGGNTKDAERGFLTGCYSINDPRKPQNSYVWYLRQQGYRTEGAHPFNGWFYNRLNVNRYLGFADYRFREDTFDALVGADTVANDAVLYEQLLQMFNACSETTPYFSFSTTFEGHGPYSVSTDSQLGTENYILENRGTAAGNALNNYLNGVRTRDEELCKLVQALRESDRPTVLLVYGDHNPTLGASSYSTDGFTEFGINMELSTEEGFVNYYSTEYLLWANDAAKAVLDFDFTGTGPTVSPCYLMNVLADALGWDGPAYLQLLREKMQLFPVLTIDAIARINGELVQTIPAQYTDDYHALADASYYWQTHFLYQNVQNQSDNEE